ncbi:MAG: helix-turn-helix transcriptional regulator [Clostridium baratii]|uniref:ArsR/SmtB family transcription factor n=1 Tax=Clostridium baratii TaxID=1561 RepID=UPI00242EB406|nr:metalloregulator ArsR/SmtB family transcription factor [Clostridium baratii]MBS6041817.1 helix-turn-helix transcriptional regulator [Clostridium baratii]
MGKSVIEECTSDKCSTNVIHQDRIDYAKDRLPKEETLYDLAELFKVFGDTTRIKIICALYESELCVCDIANLLNMTQSAVSHQLRTLKAARLVKFRRAGKVVYYSLDDEHIMRIFNEGLNHVNE